MDDVERTLERVSEGYEIADNTDFEENPEVAQELREEYRGDFERLMDALESGEVRTAERGQDGDWHANDRVKEGILLGFTIGEKVSMPGVAEIDEVPGEILQDVDLTPDSWEELQNAKVEPYALTEFEDNDTFPPQEDPGDARVVPGGSAIRRGSHVDDIIQMPPSYINVGAYVDDGSLVDSFALVGSGAQVGENVHVSTHAALGGVLEPVNKAPVVVEDEAVIGGHAGIYEGTVVREGAVVAPGTQISGSTEIYDEVEDKIYRGEVPEDAVVIQGSVEHGVVEIDDPSDMEIDGYDEEDFEPRTVTTYKDAPVIVKYVDESTEQSTALEDALR